MATRASPTGTALTPDSSCPTHETATPSLRERNMRVELSAEHRREREQRNRQSSIVTFLREEAVPELALRRRNVLAAHRNRPEQGNRQAAPSRQQLARVREARHWRAHPSSCRRMLMCCAVGPLISAVSQSRTFLQPSAARGEDRPRTMPMAIMVPGIEHGRRRRVERAVLHAKAQPVHRRSLQ